MKLFQRRKENFICEHCGNQVSGTGYTNHCPKCLYSKHVDINPGDRGNICKGLMKPVGFDPKNGIKHRCIVCRIEKYNQTNPEDSYDIIVQLSGVIT